MRNARGLDDVPAASSQFASKLPSLNSSQSSLHRRSHNLLNYDKLSSLPKVYPDARFKFNSMHMNWLMTKCDNMEEGEESDNYIDTDEGAEKEGESSPSATARVRTLDPLVIGPRAMANFFDKYKTLNRITSPANEKNPLPVYQYLKEVDKSGRIPQPMGIVKRTGASTELKLQ